MINGQEIVNDQFLLNFPGTSPIKRQGINSAKRNIISNWIMPIEFLSRLEVISSVID